MTLFMRLGQVLCCLDYTNRQNEIFEKKKKLAESGKFWSIWDCFDVVSRITNYLMTFHEFFETFYVISVLFREFSRFIVGRIQTFIRLWVRKNSRNVDKESFENFRVYRSKWQLYTSDYYYYSFCLLFLRVRSRIYTFDNRWK